MRFIDNRKVFSSHLIKLLLSISCMNSPLSPHLQIYKPQLNSIMSILHRLSGVGFFAIMIIHTFFLLVLVNGAKDYEFFCILLDSTVSKIFTVMISMCVCYHFINGIRYLVWSTGKGLGIKSIYLSGYLIIASVIIIGIISWLSL